MCFDLFTNSSNYNKSHKFNTHERPHAQSSRIKTDLKTTELFKWLFTNYLQQVP